MSGGGERTKTLFQPTSQPAFSRKNAAASLMTCECVCACTCVDTRAEAANIDPEKRCGGVGWGEGNNFRQTMSKNRFPNTKSVNDLQSAFQLPSSFDWQLNFFG